MMVQEHRIVLADVVSQVLEDQVFMFGEVCDKGEMEVSAEQFLLARVKFDGPTSGCYFWVAPINFGIELAANMLGTEPDDVLAKDNALDAMNELSNVICAQFLTTVFGTQPLFHIESPQAVQQDRAAWETQLNRLDYVGLLVDEYPVLIGLAMD